MTDQESGRFQAVSGSPFKDGGISFDLLTSREPKTQMIFKQAQQLAGTDEDVLLQGESGTGKNFFALAIQKNSPRANRPFVVINCTTNEAPNVEADLFGSASAPKSAGLLADHKNGTVVLDEIGDLPAAVQRRLLEYLQTPSSAGKPRARVLALSCQNIGVLVKAGTYLKELHDHFAGHILTLPPLRERRVDLPHLAEHFLQIYRVRFAKKASVFSKIALEALMRYHFPGNMRELKNLIKRSVLNSSREQIWIEDFNFNLIPPVNNDDQGTAPNDLSLKAMECQHIMRVLKLTRGNKSQASRILGISRPTLDKKIHDYSIQMNFKTALVMEDSSDFDVETLKKKGKS